MSSNENKSVLDSSNDVALGIGDSAVELVKEIETAEKKLAERDQMLRLLSKPLICPGDYIQSIDKNNKNVCVGPMGQKYKFNGKSYEQSIGDTVTCKWGSADFDIYGNPVCVYHATVEKIPNVENESIIKQTNKE